MWQDIGNFIFITTFFVVLPVGVDVVVLWRLSHASSDCTNTPARTVIGYIGLTANFFAILIVWGSFYYNLWLFNHGAQGISPGEVAGGERSYEIALVLALLSLIFGLMAPKRLQPLLVFTGLYVGFTLLLVMGGAGVL